MKKAAILIFVLVICFVFIESQNQLTKVSAQNNRDRLRKYTAEGEELTEKDRELGRTIKRLTKRSTENLKTSRTASGAYSIDLEEGFQNVMIARINPEEEAEGSCITSLNEANAFFGKDLETGKRIPQIPFRETSKTDVNVSQYGMSEQEYNFYTNLVEQAVQYQSTSASSIVIVNNDGAGEGFNDQTATLPEGGNDGGTLGQQRLNLFNRAAAIWSAFLDTRVTINVRSQFDPQGCTATSATLGSAGTTSIYRDFTNAPYANTWYSYALANKFVGSDINPTTPEINATFNSSINNDPNCLAGRRWYYGYDNVTPAGTVNLLVVLLHEMGHGLGFQSFVKGDTGQLAGNDTNGRFPDIFTKNMYDRTVGKYWSDMTDAERQTSALNTGNVLWDGANVKNASGFLTFGRESSTGRVQLYTPATFASGSSISHFDTTNFPNLLMEPNINLSLPIDMDLTRQQMRDIGWFRDSNGDGEADSISNVQTNSGTLPIGGAATVTWTNNGGFNRPVIIELSTNGGANYSTVIASDIENTGSFTFTVPSLPTTQGKIRVREANFVDPSAVSAANFNIASVSLASVSGRIVTATGKGIPGAAISVVGTNGYTQTIYTNRTGYYQLSGIPIGETYTFTVKSRYKFGVPTVQVINGNTNNLIIRALP